MRIVRSMYPYRSATYVRGTCAHMRSRMRPCTRIGNTNVIAANRASKLIPGRDEIRPVGRVSSIVRLIDDARSLGPGKRYYENARERPRERRGENEASEPGRLRNLLLRTRNRRYMELTSGPIKFNDR